MAFGNGPRIVTNGLVMSLDAADRNSYVSGSATWFDLSGNNNAGSLINGPSYSLNGKGSIVLDGVNDRIDVPKTLNGFEYNIHYDLNWTIECWMYTNTFDATPQTYKMIYGNYNGCNYTARKGNAGGILIYSSTVSSSINLGFGYGPRNVATGSQCPDISTGWNNAEIGTVLWGLQNRWAHFAMTSDDGTTLKVYIDGIQKGSSKTVSFKTSQNRIDNQLVATNDYCWGGDPVGNSANQVDFSICRMYNRALSDQEVLQNYNAQKSRFGL
jgi:hypothetical protein